MKVGRDLEADATCRVDPLVPRVGRGPHDGRDQFWGVNEAIEAMRVLGRYDRGGSRSRRALTTSSAAHSS